MKKEEALEQIRKWDLLKEEKEALETLIPELAESEDERIRKDIINLIYWLKGNPSLCSQYYNDRYDGMLDWLEKQKEQKPWKVGANAYFTPEQKPAESISQLTVQGKGVYKICPRCKERMVRDDSMVYTSMPPQYRYECPKCGESECDTVMYDNPEMEEQKPVDLSDMMVHKEPYIAPVPTPMVADEQKPAEWSEEDENMRESAIALIRKWTNYSGENVGDSIKVISWLQWLPLLAHQH